MGKSFARCQYLCWGPGGFEFQNCLAQRANDFPILNPSCDANKHPSCDANKPAMPDEATMILVLIIFGFASIAAASFILWRQFRARGMDQWVPSHLFPGEPRPKTDLDDQPIDVFIAICDHYEPEWGNPSFETALGRVQRWHNEYPRLLERFSDVDGRPPRHTFFFPQDQYQPEYLDVLARLCERGYGDVDVHLHHHDDTPEGLKEKLDSFRQVLYHRHGLLRRDPVTNEIVYGFIHGNWCLCNSRRDGKWCGVDHEIPILLKTGCYADFTMPSAPSDTQTKTINSIYYAHDLLGQRKSHDCGVRAEVGKPAPDNHLLMIQGPLTFDWSRKKFGMIPRIENGDLLANHPPTIQRTNLWLNAGVTVKGRPNWRFVKLHTHGCKSGNIDMLLGPKVQRFHQELEELHKRKPNFRYHYVSAWEMAQFVHQAEQQPSNGQPLAIEEVSAVIPK